MKSIRQFTRPTSILCVTTLGIGLMISLAARADVVGRLRLHVLNAADGKPIVGAHIVLSDTAGMRPSWPLTTDARGEVLSRPLENRDWQLDRITLAEDGTRTPVVPAGPANTKKTDPAQSHQSGTPVALNIFAPEQRRIRIVADTTTEATLLIDVAGRQLTKAHGAGQQVSGNQVGNVTRRDQAFIQMFPLSPGNPQSLNRVLQTVPGVSGRAAHH